jgi:EAL domain-containing protein (putative c-di-GMP-specific phosphodiesterase class I)
MTSICPTWSHLDSPAGLPDRRSLLESDLRRAIGRGELVLHYQPIVRLDSRRVSGAEALIRWDHPHLGILPPACFLGLAEETGTIVPLTTWAVREAFAQVARWDEQDVAIARMAVNLSAHQLREPDFARTIGRIAEDKRIDPRRIELDVPESVLVAGDRRSLDTLHDLKARGFGIAIDDFGIAYSSFSSLQRLPVDRLKIDRAFVRDLGSSEQSAAIVELIISIARRLGLCVTAEGVETAEQLEFLAAHGCDEIQGYYLGEPEPPAVIEHTVIRPAYAASSVR